MPLGLTSRFRRESPHREKQPEVPEYPVRSAQIPGKIPLLPSRRVSSRDRNRSRPRRRYRRMFRHGLLPSGRCPWISASRMITDRTGAARSAAAGVDRREANHCWTSLSVMAPIGCPRNRGRIWFFRCPRLTFERARFPVSGIAAEHGLRDVLERSLCQGLLCTGRPAVPEFCQVRCGGSTDLGQLHRVGIADDRPHTPPVVLRVDEKSLCVRTAGSGRRTRRIPCRGLHATDLPGLSVSIRRWVRRRLAMGSLPSQLHWRTGMRSIGRFPALDTREKSTLIQTVEVSPAPKVRTPVLFCSFSFVRSCSPSKFIYDHVRGEMQKFVAKRSTQHPATYQTG